MIKSEFKKTICCFAIFAMFNCQSDLGWKAQIPDTGTYSSPRAIDLNNDNIKDVVIGAGGKEEWDSSENGVLAINGKNGNLLWKVPCRNQMVGSAIFMDINQDNTPDVIIGGRSAQLLAINGASGDILWELIKDDGSIDFKNDTTILNFFNPQFIPDQDNDGIEDILIAYGGFVKAAPYDENRPSGYLMIISANDGRIISKAAMPDGKETYLSPVIFDDGARLNVLFGTGGETIPGDFFITPLSDLLDHTIEEHQVLVSGLDKGFIAPPLLADMNHDDRLDIIVTAYDGKTYAINGDNLELLWQVDFGAGFETHSQPGIGYLNQDSIPDLFLNLGQGSWPHIENSIQVIIDGASGKWKKIFERGILQYSSPISFENINSRQTNFLLPVNEKAPTVYAPESGMPAYKYSTSLYVFTPGGVEIIINTRDGINIGSTVLMEDLNQNGDSEIVMIYNLVSDDPFIHQGIAIECFPYTKGKSHWLGYMGPDGRSYFKPYKSGQ